MTQLQLHRKVKSLAWRRYLAESLEQIESEIIDYIHEKNTNRIIIAGYLISLADGNLMLAKLPFVDFDQLEIEFPYLKDERFIK